MAKKDIDSIVDDAVEEIELKQDNGELDVIANAKEEPTDDRRPAKHKFKDFLKTGKFRALLAFVILLGAILAVPMTRYALLGVFIHRQTKITVVDDTTGKPVTDALVQYARADAKTDKNGVATINSMSVGDHPLKIEKKYYETIEASYTVPIFGEAKTKVRLKATGRVAVINVKNKISGNPVVGAQVKVADTSAITDDKGVASVALAIHDANQPGSVTAEGYNVADLSVSTKEISPTQDVELVPSGKTYFLSNRTGSYDVMSTTLDGKTEVVLSGIGREVGYELNLSTSPNRKYLALSARREVNKPALYMIDTATNAAEKVEDAQVNAIGWIGNTFYYALYDTSNNAYVDKRVQLVSYNAAEKQRNVVDASKIEGDQYNYAELALSGRFQLVGSRVYYAKCWNYTQFYSGETNRKASLISVADGKVNVIKEVPQTGSGYCDTLALKPNQVYFRIGRSSGDYGYDTYRFQPGKTAESVQVSDGELYNSQVTYLASSEGTKTFWTEVRDGKKVSFIGNSDGGNAEKVSEAEYEAYGWFGNDYVLYSKNGSELYVAAQGAQLDGAHKIADFYSQPRGPGY